MSTESETWQRVRTLFAQLVELPAGERGGWLERNCAGEPQVRAQLERLLAADGATQAWLRPHPSLEGLLELPPSGLAPGTDLGPYRLHKLIATGGMGAVWLAEQTRPRRLVALKTLRADLSGSEAQRRFRVEAELLGHLRHPGIAQVFDAGTAALDGRELPYLAMEYVEGSRNLLEAARERGLDRRGRLRLFAEVCDAVHHGHQRGVLHRDLKPGNVLVDAEGHPKVIDFGLARALDPAGLDITLAHTRAGEILGTVAYMSPEHVSGRSFEVDVRSDVYALGCILCELSVGRPPLELGGLALPEVARRITEVEPRLPASLPADLRWVLAKTLEKNPARRYASASELAADVRRMLTDQPVLAGPPRSLYRLSRSARRHRASLLAGAAVLAALLGGLVQARREARAAELARGQAQARGVQADASRVEAERQAGLARTAGFFLSELFRRSEVLEGGRDARVADAIAEAEDRLASIDDPTARAILGSIVGKGYLYLEDRARAGPLLERALETLRRELRPDDLFRLDAEVVYADFLEQEQRHAESIALSEELLPRLEAQLGPGHALTCYLRFNLAMSEQVSGNPRKAELLYRRSLELVEEREGQDSASAQRVDLLRCIGRALVETGRAEEGIEELGRALGLSARLEGTDPQREATIHMDLGSSWMHAGDFELALYELQEAERLYAAQTPSLNNRYALALNLASCLLKLGRLEEAQNKARQARQALAAGWTAPGPRHASLELLQTQISLKRGELEQAEASARAGLALARQVLAPEASQTLLAHVLLARVLLARDRPQEALVEARAGCEALQRRTDVDEAAVAAALGVWVEALLATGEHAEAGVRAAELLARTPLDSPRRVERETLLRRARGGS